MVVDERELEMAKTPKKVPRWGIYPLRKRGHIGSVEAPDAEAAIATAITKIRHHRPQPPAAALGAAGGMSGLLAQSEALAAVFSATVGFE